MTEQTPESRVRARPPVKRKTGAGKRARKFPLTLHPTGQSCKKIRGKIHYFGRDKQEALRRYYEQVCLSSVNGTTLDSRLSLSTTGICALRFQTGILPFPEAVMPPESAHVPRHVSGAKLRG